MIDYKKKLIIYFSFLSVGLFSSLSILTLQKKMIYNETCTANWVIFNDQGTSKSYHRLYV